jgi:hypothetical protein
VARIDFSLEVSEVTQQLEVTGGAPLVVRNNSIRASRRLLQRIFVVKSAENWLAQDDVPGGDAMATSIRKRRMLQGFWERCRRIIRVDCDPRPGQHLLEGA